MNDEKLIQIILNGDGERYDDIVERYQSQLYRTAYYYTLNSEDARDLTQEIFIKAYNNLNKFKHGSAFSTWLYRIAVNHCIDWNRKKKHFHEDPAFLNNLQAKENSPEDLLLRQEMITEVHEAVNDLPKIYKTIFILYYFENLNPQQIADILNTSKRTVETRLFRGRKLLKGKIHNTFYGGDRHDLPPNKGQLAQLR